MNTGEKNYKINSLLQEKKVLNERLQNVYELIFSDKYDEGLYELEDMTRRYPYIVDIYHLKFKIYCIKENYKLAEKVLDEAGNLFKDNEKIFGDRIYLQNIKASLKNEYLLNGEYEALARESEAEISKESINNYDSSSYYYRALSYRMMSNENSDIYYSQAKRYYENISFKEPKNYDAQLYRALCYKDTKEYGQALKLINKILSEDKKNRAAIKMKTSIIKKLHVITNKSNY